jgi:hypothetical protein
MVVKIINTASGNPPGRLADAELHFTEGVLEGLKLIGFTIWERRTGGGRNVTFPARSYAINGERRSFALLRPSGAVTTERNGVPYSDGQDRVRELILQAYAETEVHTATTDDEPVSDEERSNGPAAKRKRKGGRDATP